MAMVHRIGIKLIVVVDPVARGSTEAPWHYLGNRGERPGTEAATRGVHLATSNAPTAMCVPLEVVVPVTVIMIV
jgi:hypothetical protein